MKRLSISPTAVVILLCTLAICMVSIFVISPAQAAVDPENLFEFGGEYYYFDDYGNMYLYDEEAEKTPEGADGDSSGGDYGSIPSGNGVFSISDQSGGYYGDIPTGEEALGAITGQTDLPEVTTDDVRDSVDRSSDMFTSAASISLIVVAIILSIYGLFCLIGSLLLLFAWRTGKVCQAIAGSVILTIAAVLGPNLIALAAAVLGWIGVWRLASQKPATNGDYL